MSDRLLGATEIREAFRRMAVHLARRGVVGDVCVFGGAAMILAYDARRATRDVDAIFEPHSVGSKPTELVTIERARTGRTVTSSRSRP